VDLNKSNIKKIMLMVCGAILFTFILFNFGKLMAVGKWILTLLMPFFIGFAIAFIINVPMKGFENVLFKNETGRFYKYRRPVCIVLSLLCVVAIVTFVITMLVPEISATINSIGEKFPETVDSIKKWAISLTGDYPGLVERITDINVDWDNITGDVIAMVKNGGGSLLSSTFSFASSVVSGVIDFVVGIFFAIYILAQKENLEKQCKGLLYAFVKEKTADRIIRACGMADQTFSNFITGQCLEACILGFMFFIAMHIFSIPYALTISVTIAVTALIPVFGAFVGCGVGAFLILVEDPKKVIVFLILFIVLQQIEGNLIYPHVVGGSVGLPSIWVLAAVVLGGNVMGVIGMLVFVPLFSVIYALLKEFVLVRLKERNIPWSKYGEKMPITGTAGTVEETTLTDATDGDMEENITE
jgi:predicted PurR-regulated permease PerM